MATTNYNLPIITGNMTADVVRDMNALAEATDSAIKDAVDGIDLTSITNEVSQVKSDFSSHISDSKEGAHKAKNIFLEDVDGFFIGTEVETAMKELFSNVSNGKLLIGTAITDVDGDLIVPNNPTFPQLASLIRNITTGKKYAEGNGTPGSNGLIVNGLSFRPGIILVQRQGYANQYNTASAIHANIPNFKISLVTGSAGGAASGNSANVTVTDTGFTMKGIEIGWTHNWMALE